MTKCFCTFDSRFYPVYRLKKYTLMPYVHFYTWIVFYLNYVIIVATICKNVLEIWTEAYDIILCLNDVYELAFPHSIEGALAIIKNGTCMQLFALPQKYRRDLACRFQDSKWSENELTPDDETWPVRRPHGYPAITLPDLLESQHLAGDCPAV